MLVNREARLLERVGEILEQKGRVEAASRGEGPTAPKNDDYDDNDKNLMNEQLKVRVVRARKGAFTWIMKCKRRYFRA